MKKRNPMLLAALLCCAHSLIAKEAASIFQDVRNGDASAIKKRLENHEDCSQKEDRSGNNALHIAAELGKTEIVEMLTTEPDYSEWGNWLYYSLWQSPAKLPNKDEKNNLGNTPTHCALENDHIDTAECLINKDANVELVNNENLSPASLVIKKDNPELVPFLIKSNLINQKKNNGDNLLHTAVKTKKARMVAQLAEIGSLASGKNNDGKTPTIVATELSDIEMLEILKRKNIDLNAPGNNGFRPIHNATMRGNYKALEFLLANGVHVDTDDNSGNTPLLYAGAYNKERELDLLLTRGADIQRRNLKGEDIFAIASRNEHYNLISRFKGNPAVNINTRDNNGQTSFVRSVIQKNHKLMQTLMDAGVNIHITDNNNENALHKTAKTGDIVAAKMILAVDKKLATDVNKNGDNPAFTAVQWGQFQLAQLFVNSGAPLTTNDGNTPAHTAQTVEALHNCLKYDPQAPLKRNKYNETPFLTATRTGKLDIVTTLVCDNDFRSKDIGVGINLARSNNHHDIVTFLQKAEQQRLDRCREIANQPLQHDNVKNSITNLHINLCQKDGWRIFSQPQSLSIKLNRYSADDLYYMTETDRAQISLAYTQAINSALQEKTKLEQEYNVILLKEQSEYQAAQQLKNQQAKLAQERAQAEQQRQRILAQEERDRKILADQQAEFDRIAQQKQTEDLAKKAQADELERIAKQKKADDELRAQQTEYNRLNVQNAAAAQKEAAERAAAIRAVENAERARQQQYDQALDKQQPHVQMDLKPSAPVLEKPVLDKKGVEIQCAACGEKAFVAPLPCRVCKKSSISVCKPCAEKHKGQCYGCWQTVGQFTQKEDGECCVNNDKTCTETSGVTHIPSDCCKVGSERICKTCLKDCIARNTKAGQPNCCPICNAPGKLNQKIVDAIMKQK